MGCGTRLCSDFFEVCGQLFRLEVYPGGFTADACRYVSVFLTTPGSLNPNHIMYEIAILDQVGPFRQLVEHLHAHILVSLPVMDHDGKVEMSASTFIWCLTTSTPS